MTAPRGKLSVLLACTMSLFAFCFLGACEEVQARRHIQNGNKSYYEGEYERSILEYETALKSKPELYVGWYNLGLAHLALFSPGLKTPENDKHAQGAIVAFQKYLEHNKEDTKARDYLLSTYIDSGHYEGALKYFEDKLTANPKDLNAIAQLAQINSNAGNFEKANEWNYKRAELENTTDGKADALYTIGVLSWRRISNHPMVVGDERAKIADQGIAALQKADQIRPEHQATLTYMNLLYRERANGSDDSWARAVDQATAQIYYKHALEIAKKNQGTPQPGGAPKPPAPANKQ